MSGPTTIEWATAVWNPTRGCSRVSEGCRNCYAERLAARFHWGKPYARMTTSGPRWSGRVDMIESALDAPLRHRRPERWFVNSVSDLFHEELTNEQIALVFHVMYGEADARPAPNHRYMILTKRALRMREWFRWLEKYDGDDPMVEALSVYLRLQGPHAKVALGVSVEDQPTADERIPLLLQTPAAKRFVSYEPALAAVDFEPFLQYEPLHDNHKMTFGTNEWVGLDWIIVGGESGPGARPFDVSWARSVVRQCRNAGVACFVKQMGGNVRDRNDRLATDRPAPYRDMWPEPERGWDDGPNGNWEELDTGYQGAPIRIKLRDRKGGDMSEWPEDLRVREFPLALMLPSELAAIGRNAEAR